VPGRLPLHFAVDLQHRNPAQSLALRTTPAPRHEIRVDTANSAGKLNVRTAERAARAA
jgi:hypothetical protein